jgi:hypothetical protein
MQNRAPRNEIEAVFNVMWKLIYLGELIDFEPDANVTAVRIGNLMMNLDAVQGKNFINLKFFFFFFFSII